VDVRGALTTIAEGGSDPSISIGETRSLVAQRTPDGPATLALAQHGTTVEAEAWGPGAAWALEHAPGLIGAEDDPAGFDPGRHPVVERLARSHRAVRILRTGLVTETLLRTVVGQVVTGREAKRSYARMTRATGEPAPGPHGLVLPPDPAVIGRLAYHRFHPWGIERRRAETLIRVAKAAPRMEEAAAMSSPDAAARITAVPGVGPWTAGKVGLVALGDPDAVPVGDYHLPNTVAWALAGEPRADDDRMLELLEPFAGHRGRVVLLLGAAHVRAPKYGPRAPIRQHL
jgi:3-methyladenine DNA glycosylase/8-oxoguanine DNA glycosylase